MGRTYIKHISNWNQFKLSILFRDANILQENSLLDYMTQNPRLANDQFDLTDKKEKYVYERLWMELKETLNADGPPCHTLNEWKEVSILKNI